MDFPAPHFLHPEGTVILLHGRGSNGPEFADDIFLSKTSQGVILAASLPTYRWIFPTSRNRWNTASGEEVCFWFDAYSLVDIQAKQEQQKEGLRESIWHILGVLDEEVKLLDGKFGRVYLGRISQGMATAIWAFLGGMGRGRIREPLAGLLGFSSEGFFGEVVRGDAPKEPVYPLSTPVFISHGTDDRCVPVELGLQAWRILRMITFHVDWNEFTGAENDGHWIKEPVEFDQILQFLDKRGSESAS